MAGEPASEFKPLLKRFITIVMSSPSISEVHLIFGEGRKYRSRYYGADLQMGTTDHIFSVAVRFASLMIFAELKARGIKLEDLNARAITVIACLISADAVGQRERAIGSLIAEFIESQAGRINYKVTDGNAFAAFLMAQSWNQLQPDEPFRFQADPNWIAESQREFEALTEQSFKSLITNALENQLSLLSENKSDRETNDAFSRPRSVEPIRIQILRWLDEHPSIKKLVSYPGDTNPFNWQPLT